MKGNGELMKSFRQRDDKIKSALKSNFSCCFMENELEEGRTGIRKTS